MGIASSNSWRKSWLVLGMVLCAMTAAMATPGGLAAQEDEAAATVATDKANDPAIEASSSTAAADNDGANAAATKKKEQSTSFAWLIECSGFIGFVILLLSIYFVSTVARLFWEMRIDVAAPPTVVTQCEGLLEKRDFKQIYGVVKGDDSFFSRLLTAGIAELPNGLAEARETMERLGDAITTEMVEEDQHVGRARHAGTDDWPAGHAEGDDSQLQRHRAKRSAGAGQRRGGRTIRGAGAHFRGCGAGPCRRYISMRCFATG